MFEISLMVLITCFPRGKKKKKKKKEKRGRSRKWKGNDKEETGPNMREKCNAGKTLPGHSWVWIACLLRLGGGSNLPRKSELSKVSCLFPLTRFEFDCVF